MFSEAAWSGKSTSSVTVGGCCQGGVGLGCNTAVGLGSGAAGVEIRVSTPCCRENRPHHHTFILITRITTRPPWPCWRTSITNSVLPHLVGCRTVWCWILAVSPTTRGRSRRVLRPPLVCLHMPVAQCFFPGIQRFRPRRVGKFRHEMQMACDISESASGVLRCYRVAFWNASVTSSPLGPVLPLMSRFILFTPIYTLQFESGKSDRR